MDNNSYIDQMLSYKGMFYRSFFMCRECEFVFTTLGQANHEIEGMCPACGGMDCDYAPEGARTKFLKGFKEELEVFEKELKNEEER